MNEKTLRLRLRLIEWGMLAFFVILVAKLVYLHGGFGEDRAGTVDRATRYVKPLVAFRGRIFDGGRTTNLLAISLGVHNICADPSELAKSSTNMDLAVSLLARRLDMDPAEVRYKLRRTDKKFAYVKRFVTRDISEPLVAEAATLRLRKAIFLEDDTTRRYPQNGLACHVVGYVNHEGVGSAGIELGREKDLQGRSGLLRGMKDAHSKEIYERRIDLEPPRQGCDIHLTLDQQIQFFTERALDEVMEKHAAKAAWAVVQRCRTGEILALASRPGYNPNDFNAEADMHHRMTNRVITVNYEPGSTLKPVPLALAFSRQLVTPEMVYDTENGRWLHAGRILRDYHPYVSLSVADIIKKSSNIGTAKIALQLGDMGLFTGLKSFGFGRRTGIELPYEEGGILPNVTNWSALSCSRISIGQGIAVTALQMAGMMSAIANDGFLLKPYLIRQVVDADGKVVYAARPELVERPLDASVAALMRYLLARVTEDGGTGTRARVDGFRVAGKTGTAQKVIGGRYSESQYIASFAGFLPVHNPEITIVVVVDEPQPYHTGGVVAAPAFARIADPTVRYLNLEPREEDNAQPRAQDDGAEPDGR